MGHLEAQQVAVFKGGSGDGSARRNQAVEDHNAAEGILGRVGVGASLRKITEAIERHLSDMDPARRGRIREVVLRLQNDRLIAPTGRIQARVGKKRRRKKRQRHVDPRTTDTRDMGLTRQSKEIRNGIREVLPEMPDATGNEILAECRKRGKPIGAQSSFTNYHVPAVRKEMGLPSPKSRPPSRDPEAQPPREKPGVPEPQGEATPAESEAGAEKEPPAPPAEEEVPRSVTQNPELENPEQESHTPTIGLDPVASTRDIMMGRPFDLPLRRSVQIDLEGLIRADVRFNVDEVAKWGEDRIRLFFDSLAGMTLATLAQNGGRG